MINVYSAVAQEERRMISDPTKTGLAAAKARIGIICRGQEVEIHYRWHALYGRPVRRYYGEKRLPRPPQEVDGGELS